jgi:adenylate cyclase
MAGAGGEGLLLVPVDGDGVLRRLGDGDIGSALEPLLAPRIATRLGHRPVAGIVDFSIGAPFDYLPLHTITALAGAGDVAGLRQRFAGKIVLLGAILPDQDRQRLPVALASWEDGASAPGVLFQGQAVRTLMQDRMIRSWPWLGDGAALLAVGLLWMSRRRLGRAAVAALALAAVTLAASIWLLANGTQAPVMAPLLALTLMVGWLGAQAYLRELAEQRRIRSIFSGYVSPAILDTILSGALKDGRAGTRQPLAFLFADIRGFTAFCAANPPEQVIAFLNRYYTVVTAAMHRYGGTIDKFSGDGVMVFFGAPQPSANPARDAVLAALAMLEALAVLNLALSGEGAPEVKVGIGIAYGDAVLGNVGSPARHDYTATGAATTLAAHIQQHCKRVPHALLVEHDAFELAQLAPEQRAQFRSMPVELEKHGRLVLAAYMQHG